MAAVQRSLSNGGGSSDVVYAKVVLLGRINVGKTSLVNRIRRDMFNENTKSTVCDYLAVGSILLGGPSCSLDYFPFQPVTYNWFIKGCVDFMSVKLNQPDYNTPVILQIWDTAGQERYGSLVGFYLRRAHTAIIIYDVTNKTSFYSVSDWVSEVRKAVPNVHCVIVGNKIDDVENSCVQYREGKAFADNLDCSFYETSAKTGENVQTLFYDIGREISKTMTSQLSRKSDAMRISGGSYQQNVIKKRRCCWST